MNLNLLDIKKITVFPENIGISCDKFHADMQPLISITIRNQEFYFKQYNLPNKLTPILHIIVANKEFMNIYLSVDKNNPKYYRLYSPHTAEQVLDALLIVVETVSCEVIDTSLLKNYKLCGNIVNEINQHMSLNLRDRIAMHYTNALQNPKIMNMLTKITVDSQNTHRRYYLPGILFAEIIVQMPDANINKYAEILNNISSKTYKNGPKFRSMMQGLLVISESKELNPKDKLELIANILSSHDAVQQVQYFMLCYGLHKLNMLNVLAVLINEKNKSFKEIHTILIKYIFNLNNCSSNRYAIFWENLNKLHDPSAILTYYGNLQSVCHNKDFYLGVFTNFMRTCFTKNMIAYFRMRYNEQRNIHLKTIFNNYPELRDKWTNMHVSREYDEFNKMMVTDDPWKLLMCGTDVNAGCQRIDETPSLNKCLISGYILSGHVKIVAIVNADNIIQARAILRLMWDVESKIAVLFLEYIYPFTSSEQQKNAIVNMAKLYADQLNLTLVASYDPEQEPYPHAVSVLYVNGAEYVDSCGGVNYEKYTIEKTSVLQWAQVELHNNHNNDHDRGYKPLVFSKKIVEDETIVRSTCQIL